MFVHAGPFGNIAHGNSSIIADRIAHDAIAEIHMFGTEGIPVGAGRGHRGVL